jgi:hypothetical protein
MNEVIRQSKTAGNFKKAIQFWGRFNQSMQRAERVSLPTLLFDLRQLKRRSEEAFELAQTHDAMDSYARLVADAASPEEILRLAKYYESRTAFGKAAAFYDKCGQAKQALRLYLRSGVEGDVEQVGLGGFPCAKPSPLRS